MGAPLVAARPPRNATPRVLCDERVVVVGSGPAGTFAALMLGGNSLLVSMGFAISFGIFVAAFVMSMFFTPALTALIGHAAWWPGHGDETQAEHDARVGASHPERPGH